VSSAEVVYEVRELRRGYYTYDVALRPADGLPAVRQASGATRCEREAELAAALAIGLIAVRLARMGAAPLPVRRIGRTPRRQRVGYALGFMLGCAGVGLVLGAALTTLIWLVTAIR
jgi:hypothetical protein